MRAKIGGQSVADCGHGSSGISGASWVDFRRKFHSRFLAPPLARVRAGGARLLEVRKLHRRDRNAPLGGEAGGKTPVNIFPNHGLPPEHAGSRSQAGDFHGDLKTFRPKTYGQSFGRIQNIPMNTTPLQPVRLRGFKVVPKRRLRDFFSPSQNAYYILLGRRGPSHAPRERVLFVHYLDHFLDTCHRQIEALWDKHRVVITHVAVKAGKQLRPAHHDLAELYHRAVTVQHLRDKLRPRFRRL